MKVYILLRRITEYRIGALEEIAKAVPELVVLTEQVPNRDVSFVWMQVVRRDRLGFGLVDLPEVGGDDVFISGLDLRNLSVWQLILCCPERFVLWGHGFGRRRLSVLARWVRVLVAKRVSASLFYTEGGRRAFLPFVPYERMFVATNTIRLPANDIPAEDRRDSFLYFGDLRSDKGVHLLIEAFEIVASRATSDLVLIIVGNGTAKDDLMRRAMRSPHADRIGFHPRTVTPEELKPYLDRAIATVSPLHVGLSVVQSFWAGVPIITQRNASHAPEFEYCVNGENSLIFDGGTKSLAEAMVMLLDEQLHRELSEAARRYFDDNLQIDAMVEGFVQSVGHVQAR